MMPLFFLAKEKFNLHISLLALGIRKGKLAKATPKNIRGVLVGEAFHSM